MKNNVCSNKDICINLRRHHDVQYFSVLHLIAAEDISETVKKSIKPLFAKSTLQNQH